MEVFYRKYRPQKFSEVVGQKQVSETLKRSLEAGKLSHAYLFTGPKGIGKTSTARILAKAINCEAAKVSKDSKDTKVGSTRFGEPCDTCESCVAIREGRHLDVLEIDAASNRGIDEIRDLREKIRLAPSSAKYKVYIIDEAHMLTNEAFNALLKTLEEPPEHAVFILCTTEPHKLPQTIISRCQRFDFYQARGDSLQEYLKRIVDEEKLKTEPEALDLIAQKSEGSFRDAAKILDQIAASFGKVTLQDSAKLLALSEKESLAKFFDLLSYKKTDEALQFISSLAKSGVSLREFSRDFLEYLRKILLMKVGAGGVLSETEGKMELEKLSNKSALIEKKNLIELINIFIQADIDLRTASIAQLPYELAVVKFIEEEGKNATTEPQKKMESQKKNATADTQEELEGSRDLEKENGEKDEVLSGKEDFVKEKIEFQKLKEEWLGVLAKVKEVNPSLETLLRAAELGDFDGEILRLKFYYRFHKDKVSEYKNLQILDRILQEKFGRKFEYKLILGDRKVDNRIEQERPNVTVVADSDLEEAAAEIFS